jgi:hypothetical protein
MKFDCKEISISDEIFGCRLTFSEERENAVEQMKMSLDQQMRSSGQYLLLQRTYPEDDFENDYYYFETNDPDKSGELELFEIELNRNRFLMRWEKESFEIAIHPTDAEFDNLKEILVKLAQDKGKLLIQ